MLSLEYARIPRPRRGRSWDSGCSFGELVGGSGSSGIVFDLQVVHHGNRSAFAGIFLGRQVFVPGVHGASERSHPVVHTDAHIFDFVLDEEDRAGINGFERNRRLIDPVWVPKWDT